MSRNHLTAPTYLVHSCKDKGAFVLLQKSNGASGLLLSQREGLSLSYKCEQYQIHTMLKKEKNYKAICVCGLKPIKHR